MSWKTIFHVSQENILLSISIGHVYVSVRYAYVHAKLSQEHHSDSEMVLRLWSQHMQSPIKCSNHICDFICTCPHWFLSGCKSLASHRSPKVPGNSEMKFSALLYWLFTLAQLQTQNITVICLVVHDKGGNGLHVGLVQAVWSTSTPPPSVMHLVKESPKSL